jgi:hypothetical protein
VLGKAYLKRISSPCGERMEMNEIGISKEESRLLDEIRRKRASAFE